jgi:hypothetical protein
VGLSSVVLILFVALVCCPCAGAHCLASWLIGIGPDLPELSSQEDHGQAARPVIGPVLAHKNKSTHTWDDHEREGEVRQRRGCQVHEKEKGYDKWQLLKGKCWTKETQEETP